MKNILAVIVVYLILGMWFSIIPFPVKQGWHGPHGEFCGIVYYPSCDETTIRFMNYAGIYEVVKYKAY